MLCSLNLTRADRRARPAARKRRPGKALTLALVALITVLGVMSALLFVWPPQGMPRRVDAIFVLDGPGNRYPLALRLAAGHRAPVLVISTSTPIAAGSSKCSAPVAGVKIICFNPDPQTTQGEAEFAGRLIRHYHWKTIALVTIAPQDLRARLRFWRCTSAKIYVVNAPIGILDWPYQVAYQWGAMAKALLFQRSC